MPPPESPPPLPDNIETPPLINDIEKEQHNIPDPHLTKTEQAINALEQQGPDEARILNGETFKQIANSLETITLLSDFSQGKTEEDEIPIDSQTAIRLLDMLKEKNIPYFKILLGGVAAFVAIQTGRKIKNNVDEFIEMKRIASLNDEQWKSFLSMVDKHYETVYSYLSYKIHGDPLAVEDLTQTVFKRALSVYKKFIPKENLEDAERLWLIRITHNLAKNYYRDQKRKKKRQIQATDLKDPDSGREIVLVDPILNEMHSLEYQISVTSESILQLRKAIASLPEKRRYLLYLKHQLGLSNQEIADVMKTTEGAIKSLLYRTNMQFENIMVPDQSQRIRKPRKKKKTKNHT